MPLDREPAPDNHAAAAAAAAAGPAQPSLPASTRQTGAPPSPSCATHGLLPPSTTGDTLASLLPPSLPLFPARSPGPRRAASPHGHPSPASKLLESCLPRRHPPLRPSDRPGLAVCTSRLSRTPIWGLQSIRSGDRSCIRRQLWFQWPARAHLGPRPTGAAKRAADHEEAADEGGASARVPGRPVARAVRPDMLGPHAGGVAGCGRANQIRRPLLTP